MTQDRWIAIGTAIAVLVFPALSRADHHEAGGQAEEHRSEKAAEHSNAQWDEDNEGRPDKARGDREGEEGDEAAAKDKLHEKDKKDKKDKKEKKGKKNKKDEQDEQDEQDEPASEGDE